jgi:flagellar hook-length control protein FliK
MDSSPNEAPVDQTYDVAMSQVADDADLATGMEIKALTRVGNHSDIPSVSSDAAAQVGAPSKAVAHDRAAGDAFEVVKHGILGLPTTSFEDATRKVSTGDGAHLEDFSLSAAIGSPVDVTKDSSQVLPITQIASAPIGSVDGAMRGSEGIGPMTAGELGADEALALSMMVAGRVAAEDQQKAKHVPLTTSDNNPESLVNLKQTTGMSDAGVLDVKGKSADNLLVVTPEPLRAPNTDASLEQRALVSAAAGTEASPMSSPVKRIVNVEQPLDLSQASKQQQASEMATFIRVLKNQGGGEAKINLHPAELGRMSISVSTDATDTKVSFVVETAQARQVIEAAMPKLKELLEQSGLSLSDSDVSERRQQAGTEKNNGRAPSGQSRDLSEAQSEGGELTLSVALDTNRLLDAYA